MKIDEQKLYNQYKKIQKTCLEQGRPIPFIISPYHIPEKYKYNNNELIKLDINKEKLHKNELERKRIEYSIIKGKSNLKIIDLWMNEFKQFIKENPDFKDIIKMKET